MDNFAPDQPYCAVPAEVVKGLFYTAFGGLVVVALARMAGIDVSQRLVLVLISFFLATGILLLHALSILRKPGMVLLFGGLFLGSIVRLQGVILSLL